MNIVELLNQVNANVVMTIFAVTYVIVGTLKVTPYFKKNQYLPIVALFVGMICGAIWGGYSPSTGLLIGVADGILAGGFASAGGHELISSISELIGRGK